MDLAYSLLNLVGDIVVNLFLLLIYLSVKRS